jgi:hypothetical protein
MSAPRNQKLRRERGQTTAEFVIVFPFLILLFFLMVDFGWLFKNWLVVTNTGREVARCAAVSNCRVEGAEVGPISLGEQRIDAGLFSNISNRTVTVQYVEVQAPAGLNRGDSIVVCIEADNEYIAPTLEFLSMVSGGSLSNPMPLRARTEMRVERVAGTYADIAEGDGSCGFS